MTKEEQDERSWTLAQVEEQERKEEELAARIEKLRKREHDISEQLAEIHAGGEGDVEALMRERRECAALRGDTEAALPILRSRIAERREHALRQEAARRLVAISRGYGSCRASYRRDEDRVEKTSRAQRDAVGRLLDRYIALQAFQTEALVLLDRFPDLDPPILEPVQPPALLSRAVEALNGVRGLTLPRGESLPRRLVDVRGRDARNLRKRIANTPGGQLIEQAGDWSVEEHDERHEDAMRASREAGDRKRLEEAERVDSWLQAMLSAGPVEKEQVLEAARQHGIRTSGPGLDTLTSACRRLGVLVVHPVTERPSSAIGAETTRRISWHTSYWALSGFDTERFRGPHGSTPR